MNIEEDSFRDALLEAGKLLGHFHLGETNRRPPGLGRIPWPEICGTLQEINYQGAVVLEPFIIPGGEIGHTVPVYRNLLAIAISTKKLLVQPNLFDPSCNKYSVNGFKLPMGGIMSPSIICI